MKGKHVGAARPRLAGGGGATPVRLPEVRVRKRVVAPSGRKSSCVVGEEAAAPWIGVVVAGSVPPDLPRGGGRCRVVERGSRRTANTCFVLHRTKDEGRQREKIIPLDANGGNERWKKIICHARSKNTPCVSTMHRKLEFAMHFFCRVP